VDPGSPEEPCGGGAHGVGFVLYELTPQQVTLEDAFIDLTQDEVEFKTHRPSEAAHTPTSRPNGR
jgi:hypothetical protein